MVLKDMHYRMHRYSSSDHRIHMLKRIVQSSSEDDEAIEKLKPANTRLNAAMIDRIVNRPRLPPAPAQAISEIPVILASKLNSSTSKGKGVCVKGRGLHSNDAVDNADVSKTIKKRKV